MKIDPANIGVGLYQHDVKAKHLRDSLDEVVESCVNFVGVDLNTASAPLLRYVSGLNQLTARRLFEHRKEHGPFRSREQLKSVPGFGEATFVQAAGFLKIAGGENPLDATWIHPESYEVARRVLEKLECTVDDLKDKPGQARIAERVAQVDREQLAAELNVGRLLLDDILAQLARPGRDPREDLPPPIFKKDILKLEDLTPGMELTGTVLNVVDFGAFVDIGLKDSGLVHISQLSRKFVRDPHDVVAVGDIVRVWVLEVDKERRRVSLTMIEPGTERPPQPRRREKPEQARGGDGTGVRRVRIGRPSRKPQLRARPRSRRCGTRGSQTAATSGQPKHPADRRRVTTAHAPKPRPPLKPLTKGMKEGKEYLRTFGDLKQFLDLQQDDEKPPESPSS